MTLREAKRVLCLRMAETLQHDLDLGDWLGQYSEADAARKVHAAARGQIRAQIKPGTVVALPTAPCIAPKIETPQDALESYRVRVMRLTCVAGLGGLPQVTIPIGTASGCPVGLSFIGWAGGDEALLDLAVALSRHCGLTRD